MRAVVQRVTFARVRIDGRVVGEIGRGMLVFAGVEKGDGPKDIAYIAGKVNDLRIFNDAAGKMNVSLAEAGGAVLVVSPFTLCGDSRRGAGRRSTLPNHPLRPRRSMRFLVAALRILNVKVETGEFRSYGR